MKIRGKRLNQEYISFSEKIDSTQLEDMKSIVKKDMHSLLRGVNTLVVTLKKENRPNLLFTVIGTNLDNSKNFIDRQKLASLYETTSYSEALSQSMGAFFLNEIEELNLVGAPDNPMLRKEFQAYQKDLRQKIKDYGELLDENEDLASDYSFGNIENLSDLSDVQKKNRDHIFRLKETDSEKFDLLWVRGEYHIATIIARLENASSYSDAKLMREEILKKNPDISPEIKDYGLTVTEIINGLQISKKVNERYLYKAFSEGNINLRAMILILRNSDMIEDADKFLAIKTLQALCNDPQMFKIKDDPDRYVGIRRIIKKYNLPVHQNWRKEQSKS